MRRYDFGVWLPCQKNCTVYCRLIFKISILVHDLIMAVFLINYQHFVCHSRLVCCLETSGLGPHKTICFVYNLGPWLLLMIAILGSQPFSQSKSQDFKITKNAKVVFFRVIDDKIAFGCLVKIIHSQWSVRCAVCTVSCILTVTVKCWCWWEAYYFVFFLLKVWCPVTTHYYWDESLKSVTITWQFDDNWCRQNRKSWTWNRNAWR